MKVKSVQISNILSFKHFDDFENSPLISFDKNLSILIGQNGSGKSTILEIINFIFRRVLFVPYDKNQDSYSKKTTIDQNQRRGILTKIRNVQSYKGFRLDRNYEYENKPQKIRIIVEIDDIDRANISHLKQNREKLIPILGRYSGEQMFSEGSIQNEYVINIDLESNDLTYTASTTQDVGYTYLTAYNLYKEAIEIYNDENQDDLIDSLADPFSLIGCYRNYDNYAPHTSLGGGNTAPKQIQQLRSTEFSKSTNATEGGEPSIFSLVRLRMAKECFNLITTSMNQRQCENEANQMDFIKLINEKIKIVNLKVEIQLLDPSSWNFAFSFIDTKRNRKITDINSLSAGQKAIIHLVFEAYGRGDIKGGVIIIDEPEIHLHYQFQNEYLRIIEKLNREQGCQYILVTHSESLINSKTIKNVARLSLDKDFASEIKQPRITAEQKWLIKILDNTRSTHAFFGNKVILVEGEDDRYFFKEILSKIELKSKKGLTQDITVLDVEGKGKFEVWKELFESFGLQIFIITDLDMSWAFYPAERALKIKTQSQINSFIQNHSDLISKIEAEYKNKKFILKKGALEKYLGLRSKGLKYVVEFCKLNLEQFLSDENNDGQKELRTIMSKIVGEDENNLY